MGYDLGFAEAYLQGKWTHTNLPALFKSLASRGDGEVFPSHGEWVPHKLLARFTHRVRSSNSIKWSRKNICDHYDLGNDLFGSFLDPTMTYSCAVFPDQNATLGDAQKSKIDILLRKSLVEEGDSILDIGCGWGSLSISAAINFGANVSAVTLSDNQYDYASKKVNQLGLSGQIRLMLKDYRHVDGQFDHIFSIEMLEAVGHKGVAEFFEKCESILKPDGSLQVQVITVPDHRYDVYRKSCDYIQKHIFPGGLLLSLSTLQENAQAAGFDMVETVSIGRHYATTLANWRMNLISNWDNLKLNGFTERDLRRFLYYFCYCEGAFAAGYIDDHQITFKKNT